MEVYKITSLDTSRIYIGSTSQTKESRWGDRNSGWSHLSVAYSGDSRPLYEDIRKYGPDRFKLDTIEIIDSRDQLIVREDYWIRYYWDMLGGDSLYNMYRGAKMTGDASQMHTDAAKVKREQTMISRYGTTDLSKLISDESKKIRYDTMLARKSGICSEAAYNHRSGAYALPDGSIVYGLPAVQQYLVSLGYEITWSQTNHLINGGYLSQRMRNKYPDLYDILIRRIIKERG